MATVVSAIHEGGRERSLNRKMKTETKTAVSNGHVKSAGKNSFGKKSIVGEFDWNDVLVPSNAGIGATKWQYQRRTLLQYACLFAAGLTSFYKLESPALRAASLGFLFPGAGLIAVCTIPSLLVFVVSIALIPVCLFAWFGMGGIIFPITLWIGTSLLSAALARDSVLELAAPLWTAICIGGLAYITWQTQSANAEAKKKRQIRNEYLVEAVQQNQANATQLAPGSREVDENSLRFVQWQLEHGLSGPDDFSYNDVIDQFQTSAIRYQVYEAVSGLGLYQNVYCPNFHGYLSKAQRNLIEKSLTKKVMSFWKWESMAGKFNAHDWDPIKKDNIMVSGYILQAIGIYQSNTGDDRYAKKDSLEFVIDDTHKFKYNVQTIADAVYRQMTENPYCLFPCEPNWVYTLCNLVGISGIVLTDRLFGNSYGDKIRDRFEQALETEFSNCDGSILPIRSELTGFSIPGLAGALSDGINSILCAAFLPHIAHRNWAFTKNESISYKNNKLELMNLVGADKLDPGNYKAGEGSIRAIFAAAAAEFGDEKICKDLLQQLDDEHLPVMATPTGAFKNKGLSTIEQGTALRARIGKFQDWTRMIQEGPPKTAFTGPILEECPFPEVLVAKAYSQDGEGMDLVVYSGKEPGVFELGFTRLQAGGSYRLGGRTVVADQEGKAEFELAVDGRTEVKLELVRK